MQQLPPALTLLPSNPAPPLPPPPPPIPAPRRPVYMQRRPLSSLPVALPLPALPRQEALVLVGRRRATRFAAL